MSSPWQHPTRYKVVLRWPGGSSAINLRGRQELGGRAAYWNRIVKSKRRWLTDPEAVHAHTKRAIDDLEDLGVTEAQIREIAVQEHLEVAIEFSEENVGFAERIFPWEFVILRAVRGLHGRTKLSISRHLKRKARVKNSSLPTRRVLFIQSEPGLLCGEYTFDAEREHIRHLFETAPEPGLNAFDWLDSPTTQELETRVRDTKPDVIHMSGIDSHEGRALLQSKSPLNRQAPTLKPQGNSLRQTARDGFYLSGDELRAESIDYSDVARVLNSADKSPTLVSFNCQFSAARLAAISVAEGASFGLGIHGQSNESYVENFYFMFYRLLVQERVSVFDAFNRTIQALSHQQDDLDATDLVLWSDASAYRPGAAGVPTSETVQHAEPKKPEEAPVSKGGSDLDVEVRPHPELNYSNLHNGRGLFHKFRLAPKKAVRFPDVVVLVELTFGSETFRCRKMLDVVESLDIHDMIQVPLTWGFLKGIRESINTTIYVEVQYEEKPVYSETHGVVVHPINDWKDNTKDGRWLPSFVLPLDPAVQDIVGHARRNLRIITDDAQAKFDGYQSAKVEKVTLQAQAIWSALAHNYDIAYMDPPPAYSEKSQRLRGPSQVIRQQSGTCIDLALTYAACLEYIGLYPVLFLLDGHALTGYWTNEQADLELSREDHGLSETVSVDTDALDQDGTTLLENDTKAFQYKKIHYVEIVNLVNQGALVPVETTLIPESQSFAAAMESGLHRISSDWDFDSMLSIRQARRLGTTPLPYQVEDSTP